MALTPVNTEVLLFHCSIDERDTRAVNYVNDHTSKLIDRLNEFEDNCPINRGQVIYMHDPTM